MLFNLQDSLDAQLYVLYRDDDLEVFYKSYKYEHKILANNIRPVFKTHGLLNYFIEKHVFIIDFLDIWISLTENTFESFKKDNC